MGPMRLYMLVRIRSCLKPRYVPTFPIKNIAEKMAATFARFTQLLTIEFPYRRRSMGPMRLYMWHKHTDTNKDTFEVTGPLKLPIKSKSFGIMR